LSLSSISLLRASNIFWICAWSSSGVWPAEVPAAAGPEAGGTVPGMEAAWVVGETVGGDAGAEGWLERPKRNQPPAPRTTTAAAAMPIHSPFFEGSASFATWARVPGQVASRTPVV